MSQHKPHPEKVAKLEQRLQAMMTVAKDRQKQIAVAIMQLGDSELAAVDKLTSELRNSVLTRHCARLGLRAMMSKDAVHNNDFRELKGLHRDLAETIQIVFHGSSTF